MSLLDPPADRTLVIGDSRCGAVVDRRDGHTTKYIRCVPTGREEFYDLDADPGERHDNIASADPALLSRFRAALLQVAPPAWTTVN
jgi:hypothetical protein